MSEANNDREQVSEASETNIDSLSEEELIRQVTALDEQGLIPEADRRRLGAMIENHRVLVHRSRCRQDLLSFVAHVMPDFIHGVHHKQMAKRYEAIEQGDIRRLIINQPPRSSKSLMSSIMFPAWFLGRHPKKKIIIASHTAELAVSFGRQVRTLIDSEEYQDIFPGTELKKDSRAAGRWETTEGGSFFAVGVGGALAGRGADLLIVDDPIDEQTGTATTVGPFEAVSDWFTSGPVQRLQPGGSILVVMTRWSKLDLTATVLETAVKREGSMQWEHLELPAILPSGAALWPEFWPLKEVLKVKAELPVAKWQAQYQQTPISQEGSLIKKEYWKRWEKKNPPECSFIVAAWDTAYSTKSSSDYSAFTCFGVFNYEGDDGTSVPNLILLDALKIRVDFPELKKLAWEKEQEWRPDSTIIEAKASGTPLIQELRNRGIFVSEFSPSRKTGDKTTRVNSITDIFASGVVWVPDRRFADEVISECADFPLGRNDDLVDAVCMCVTRFRDGGFVSLTTDWVDEPRPPRSAAYY